MTGVLLVRFEIRIDIELPKTRDKLQEMLISSTAEVREVPKNVEWMGRLWHNERNNIIKI